jgi:MSHA biogenesis protein MshI
MFGFSKITHEGWLAISAETSSLRLAHIVAGEDKKPRLAFWLDSEITEKSTQHRLHLTKQHRLQHYRTITLLARDEYQLLPLETPAVPDDELKDAVRWRLQDTLEQPIDNITFDLIRVPGYSATHPGSVLVAAANNQHIERIMREFDEAELQLKAIDIPEMAQRNIARTQEEPGRALAMVHIGAEGGILTLTANGELYSSRRIDLNTAQMGANDNPYAQQQLFERVALEVQRSLDTFERQHQSVSVSRVLIGPGRGAATLASAMRGVLYLPVGQLELSEILDFSDFPMFENPVEQGRNLWLLGAAMRDLEDTLL